MRKLTHQENLAVQKGRSRTPRLPFAAVLNDIRSIYNVGAIFRTADGVGIEKLWLCGITGFPPNAQLSKTALGSEAFVHWEYAKRAEDVVRDYHRWGYQIVVLEQTDDSVEFQDFIPQAPLCLVVGNEITGVDPDILPFADAAVAIPMQGVKNSLNVEVAFGVVAYHFYCTLMKNILTAR